MGGRERLWDIFQGLAGFTDKALSFAGRMKQEAADAKLRSDEVDLIYASGNYVQSLEGRNDFENYESDWQRERDRLFAAAAKGATNNYTLRGLEKMYLYHDAQQRLAIQAATARGAGDYANALDANTRRGIMNLELRGQEKVDLLQQVLRPQYESGRISHTTYYVNSLQDIEDVIESDGERLIKEAIEATTDTEADPLSRIQRIISNMDLNAYRLQLLDPITGMESDHSRDIPRDMIREKLLKKAGTEWNGRAKQAQDANDSRLSVLYGRLKELPEGDWNTAADQALALINREMTGYRLSPEDRKKWVDSFQRVKDDLSQSAEKAKGSMWQNILDTNMAAFIQAGIRGASGDQKGMRIMYDAFDQWLVNSLEKLRQEGYKGSAADMSVEYAETIGKFFTEAEKALPDNIKGALNDAKQLVFGMYGTAANPVTSALSEKYPGMKETIAGAVVEQLRDWMFGSDLSLMTLEKAEAQVGAIVNAQVAGMLGNLDVLRTDPKTGKSGYERKFGESEEELLARAAKAMENRELVWTDKDGNTRYALGTAEVIADVQARLRERLAETLRGEGVATGEIGMELTESVADRDKDATPIFSAQGKQYRFVSDGKTLSLQTRKAGSDEWEPYTPPERAVPGRRSLTHPPDSGAAAERREIRDMIERQHTEITPPNEMSYPEWKEMINNGTAADYLERLRKENATAYNEYRETMRRIGGLR
jgi:hypothetical protein